MKKITVFLMLICSFTLSTRAQINSASYSTNYNGNSDFSKRGNSSSANHNVGISISNVIALTFVSTGNSTGNAVNIPFTSVSDYTNGVTSPVQQLKVESNKQFNISVNANSPKFTYTGNATPTPNVFVDNVLALQVIANTTGGAVASVFNNIAGSISSIAQNLVSDGSMGGHQTFSLQYKTTPGLTFPSGTYSVAVVYTASQK